MQMQRASNHFGLKPVLFITGNGLQSVPVPVGQELIVCLQTEQKSLSVPEKAETVM